MNLVDGEAKGQVANVILVTVGQGCGRLGSYANDESSGIAGFKQNVRDRFEERVQMPYVVTDDCVKDFLCVDECAMSAIAPSANDANAADASQVFINPEACIDCGACVGVCVHNAIFPEDSLPADKAEFAQKNAAYFA
jgi:ferredoxin